jgi:hypothetical protein
MRVADSRVRLFTLCCYYIALITAVCFLKFMYSMKAQISYFYTQVKQNTLLERNSSIHEQNRLLICLHSNLPNPDASVHIL